MKHKYVSEAIVFGVKHEIKGEIPVGIITVSDSADETMYQDIIQDII